MKTFLLMFFLLIAMFPNAQVKEVPFSQKKLEPINEIIKNRFVGRTESFVINEYLALYSVNSQYMVCSNLKTNKTNSIRLEDSLLYALIFNKEQIAEIEEKMILNKAKIDEYRPLSSEKHAESQMESFCYYGNHIYIRYAVMNFYGMKTLQSASKGDHESPFYFEIYLVELILDDSLYTKGRTWNMTNEYEKFNYRFSIMEDQPAYYLKTTVDEKDQYEYILLNKAWDKHLAIQAFPTMMSKYVGENIFHNVYVLNSEQHILINNQTRERLKILPGTSHLAPVYSGHFIP